MRFEDIAGTQQACFLFLVLVVILHSWCSYAALAGSELLSELAINKQCMCSDKILRFSFHPPRSISRFENASQLARFHGHRLLRPPAATGLSRDKQSDALIQDIARVVHEFPTRLAEARPQKEQQTQARVAAWQILEVSRDLDIADAIEVAAHIGDLLFARCESIIGRREGSVERVAPCPHNQSGEV
jgi:hypothetical protein